jgi:tetratricopeptide (TPR) repeat protein
MELFYNPERMSEREIKETFVAYHWLVDEIVSILSRQPKGAGVQHVVIVAPRGMGKTTLLLMLRFAVLNTPLSKRWQPVLFPEESYGVYDLADLWVDFLNHIASETGDAGLREEVSELKVSHPDGKDLEAVALGKIKDWRKKNKKRLLMLLDNFDMILEQIGDEKDNASLRDVLMNDDTLMLVGGSTTFFKEARAYDQPLYNLFKIYNLDALDSEQIEELLRRRAKLDGIENFEEILRANRTRLRVLEYFTGGNPRLVLMLYRVITHSQISDVLRGLEKLLDEVTPYYKAKIETLPPQQRKILDQIARITGQTREGLTPTQIAPATRLPVNQVSAQLKRLADLGYVRMANIPGRNSYYTLSEPLYAIWHQMRFSRETRKRMGWLIEFLKGWYDSKELGTECQRLQDIFRNYLTAGREQDARDALEHRRYLMEAIEDQQSRVRTFESIILNYLELSDLSTLKGELLGDIDIGLLTDETRQRLVAAGLLTHESISLEVVRSEVMAGLELVVAALKDGRHSEATKIMTGLAGLFPAESPGLLLVQAFIAFLTHNMEECLRNLERVLQKMPGFPLALRMKALALSETSRLEEAAKTLKQVIEIDPDFSSWYQLANILENLGRHEEALASYDEATQLKPDNYEALLGRCRSLYDLGRVEECLRSIDRIVELYPESSDAYFLRGLWLSTTNSDAGLINLKRAFDPKSSSHRNYVNTSDAKMMKTLFSLVDEDFDQFRFDWRELERHVKEHEDQEFLATQASDLLTLVAKVGQWQLARELITSSNLDEQLFPLARALDYLLQGDETSIEKLSPEVRRIVDEIVRTLNSGENLKPKWTLEVKWSWGKPKSIRKQ